MFHERDWKDKSDIWSVLAHNVFEEIPRRQRKHFLTSDDEFGTIDKDCWKQDQGFKLDDGVVGIRRLEGQEEKSLG